MAEDGAVVQARTGVPGTQPSGPVTFFPEAWEHQAIRLFVAYWALWTGLLAFIWITNPDLHHGDSYSDAHVLNAGRNFDQFGLGLNWGLSSPGETHTPQRPARPYTTYPSGGEWILQGMKALGMRQLWQFRLFPLGVTAAALILVMVVMTRLTGSRFAGLLATFFYSWSIPFSQLADALQQCAYSQFMLFAFLAAWLTFEEASTRARRARWLGVAALALFLDLWLSFEHILLMPLFAGQRMLFVGRRRDLLGAVIIGLMPLLALTTRIAHNSLALGGTQAAIDDLRSAAKWRGGFSGESVTAKSLLETWQDRLDGGGLPSDHFQTEYTYPALKPTILWPAAMLAVALLCGWHLPGPRSARYALGNGLLLLLAGGAWFAAMRNHALVHRHIVMLLLPGFGLLLAGLAAGGLAHWWTSPTSAPRRWVVPAVAVGLLVAFFAHMRSSIAINEVVKLDGRVRGIVKLRRADVAVLQAVADGMKNARWIHFVPRRYPELAYYLNRPYVFHDGKLPRKLKPDQAIWIENWNDLDRELAWKAFDRHGLPDMLSWPRDNSLIFWGQGTSHLDVDLQFEDACRLRWLRCAPTLDGGSWVLQSLFELPAHEAVDPQNLVHCLQLLDGDGNAGKGFEAALSWGLRRNRQVILRQLIPKRLIPPEARLRLALWHARQSRHLAPVRDGASLPPGATWGADGTSWIWDPFSSQEPAAVGGT